MSLFRHHEIVLGNLVVSAKVASSAEVKTLQEVCGLCFEILGDDHGKTQNLIYIMKKHEIINIELNALKIDLQDLGENHPDVAVRYNHIGDLYSDSDFKKYDKAIECYQKALNIRLQLFDEDHLLYVANSYHKIGLTYHNLGEYPRALEFYQKDLFTSLEIFGENHLEVANCYYRIATIYSSLEQYNESLEFFQKELEVRLQLHEENQSRYSIRSTLERLIGCARKASPSQLENVRGISLYFRCKEVLGSRDKLIKKLIKIVKLDLNNENDEAEWF